MQTAHRIVERSETWSFERLQRAMLELDGYGSWFFSKTGEIFPESREFLNRRSSRSCSPPGVKMSVFNESGITRFSN